LIVNLNELPSLPRDDLRGHHHRLKLKLLGTKSNRNAIGARALVHFGAKRVIDRNRSWIGPNGLRKNSRQWPADRPIALKEGIGIVPRIGWRKNATIFG
jgi:hypothetical protein